MIIPRCCTFLLSVFICDMFMAVFSFPYAIPLWQRFLSPSLLPVSCSWTQFAQGCSIPWCFPSDLSPSASDLFHLYVQHANILPICSHSLWVFSELPDSEKNLFSCSSFRYFFFQICCLHIPFS
jgi:hypothetical protein